MVWRPWLAVLSLVACTFPLAISAAQTAPTPRPEGTLTVAVATFFRKRSYAGPMLNISHVNDPKLTAMVKEQRRIKDLEARKQLIFDIQRYAVEQQYYVYLMSIMFTGSWQPYVQNYAPNPSFDYGSRAAALWLER